MSTTFSNRTEFHRIVLNLFHHHAPMNTNLTRHVCKGHIASGALEQVPRRYNGATRTDLTFTARAWAF
jgi:hypothetical protein